MSRETNGKNSSGLTRLLAGSAIPTHEASPSRSRASLWLSDFRAGGDPAAAFDTSGLTVQGRLNQLTSHVDEIRLLGRQADPLWNTFQDQDWIAYENQVAIASEESALHWVVGNYPK